MTLRQIEQTLNDAHEVWRESGANGLAHYAFLVALYTAIINIIARIGTLEGDNHYD